MRLALAMAQDDIVESPVEGEDILFVKGMIVESLGMIWGTIGSLGGSCSCRALAVVRDPGVARLATDARIGVQPIMNQVHAYQWPMRIHI